MSSPTSFAKTALFRNVAQGRNCEIGFQPILKCRLKVFEFRCGRSIGIERHSRRGSKPLAIEEALFPVDYWVRH